MKSGYFTVDGESENTIVIERSKFICSIKGVENETEAKEFIEQIRKRYSLANHHCYAYIADEKGLVQKFSDDSEPQGTAGLPMLEVLRNKRIFKTVAVVTRYFGGIKLGTGGLTRAYSGSVAQALEIIKILKMQMGKKIELCPDYEGYSRLLKFLSDDSVCVLNTEFDNEVTVTLAVRLESFDDFYKKLLDAFNGKLKVLELGEDYYSFR